MDNECPCGIFRERCDYHRAVVKPMIYGNRFLDHVPIRYGYGGVRYNYTPDGVYAQGTTSCLSSANSIKQPPVLCEFSVPLGQYTKDSLELHMSGAMDEWIPATNPRTNDNHYGLNRSMDPLRLAGIRGNAQGKSIGDAMHWAWREAYRNSSSPEEIWVSSKRDGKLIGGFVGAHGAVPIYYHDSIPDTEIWLVQKDAWELIVSCSDKEFAANDVFFGAFVCKNPSAVMRCTVDPS